MFIFNQMDMQPSSVRGRENDAAGIRLHRDAAVRPEMPERFDLVLLRARQFIPAQPDVGLQEDDDATMTDGVGKASIAVVFALDEIEPRRRHPCVAVRIGHRLPRHAIAEDRLILTIDDDCVVGPGPSEHIPPFVIQVVRVGAGIDEERIAAGVQLKAQGVSVAVAGRTVAEPSGIEDQERIRVPPAAAHHRIAAIGV